MVVQMRAYAAPSDTQAYHQVVRNAVSAIPVRFGGWEGSEIKVPLPAAKLLRPNVLFARRYEEAQSGRWASLVVVHCRDCRDMCGHYPPNCYPSSGWTMSEPEVSDEFPCGDTNVPMAVYDFSRTEVNHVRRTVVYNFFVLPGGFMTRMSEVQKASSNWKLRAYGAAQVQIIMDAGTPEAVQRRIVQDMLKPLAPVFASLQVRTEGERP